MKKRLLALFLALASVFGLLPGAAFAASTAEDVLGEIDVYHSGFELSYLSMYGVVRKMNYTYYNYETSTGENMEIPVYCVNPELLGVPNVAAVGESVKYRANELASDPKVMGIVGNGYPKRGLSELGVENKEMAYYATKIALWCYLRPGWNIDGLTVNPNLTGYEAERGQAILAAARDIYARGTTWNSIMSAKLTTSVDQDEAYPVTVDGAQYKQQVFTVNSETWVRNYKVAVSFSNPGEVPDGTRIVDMDNKDISTVTVQGTGNGHEGQFKVLYPLSSVEGKTGSAQLSLSADVYQYDIYYAICVETNKYGYAATSSGWATSTGTGCILRVFRGDARKQAGVFQGMGQSQPSVFVEICGCSGGTSRAGQRCTTWCGMRLIAIDGTDIALENITELKRVLICPTKGQRGRDL